MDSEMPTTGLVGTKAFLKLVKDLDQKLGKQTAKDADLKKFLSLIPVTTTKTRRFILTQDPKQQTHRALVKLHHTLGHTKAVIETSMAAMPHYKEVEKAVNALLRYTKEQEDKARRVAGKGKKDETSREKENKR